MDVQKFELGDDNILWPEEKHFIKLHVEQILTETSTYKMTVKRVMVSQRVNYNTFTSRSHWPNGVNGQYCFFPNIYDVK